MSHGIDAYGALSRIDNELRSRLKHDENATLEL